ncbi:hypothetical protein LZC95_48315 [Pendulispora brunnea]|uniref:Lipoprotein n=1 Tax=Pendulispora brunnea TaxID=2905690 RepID=A0ABZ2KBH7_9BACT
MNQDHTRTWARYSLVLAAVGVTGGCSTEMPNDDGSARAPLETRSQAPLWHEASSPGPLALTWSEDLAAPVVEHHGALHARIRNMRAHRADVDVVVTAKVHGRTVERYLRHAVVDAGNAETLDIEPSALPIPSQGVPFDVQLVALVSEEGRQKAVYSPSLQVALSRDRTTSFVSALDSSGPFAAARRGGSEMSLVGAEARDGIEVGEPMLLQADLPPSPTLETDASRARTSVVLCTKWSGSFSDTHLGEDFVDEGHLERLQADAKPLEHWVRDPHPARFASATVSGAAGKVWSGALDADGCSPAIRLAPGSYSFTVATKLASGTATYDILKVFEPVPGVPCTPTRIANPPKNWCESNDSISTPFTVPNSAPGYVRVNIPAGPESPATRVASVAGQMLATADSGHKANDTYPIYANSGCPYYKDPNTGVVWYNWDEACGGSTAYFGLSQAADHHDMTTLKFVIAHELGHQLQIHRLDWAFYGGGDYPPSASAPASCKCDFVEAANHLHCLQSRHRFWTAEIEGWAHFIAQRTFNRRLRNDPVFAYYKEVLTDDGVVHHPPFVLDAREPVTWVAEHCPAAEESSEWDLLTFLSTIHGGSDAPLIGLTELYGIYEKLHGLSAPQTWSGMDRAALSYFGNNASHPKYRRLHDAGHASGLDDTP